MSESKAAPISKSDTGYRKMMGQIYDEMKRIAQNRLHGERAGHTLQATALVHEAFLKLDKESGVRKMERGELPAAGARAIREILIDYARARKARKRGGNQARL